MNQVEERLAKLKHKPTLTQDIDLEKAKFGAFKTE